MRRDIPILGGLILGHLSWHWMFLINVPVAVLAIVLTLPVLPADRPASSRSPFDTLGVLLLCPGFAALVYALSRAGTAGFGALRVMIGLTLGVVLFAGYVAHALRARVTPLIDLRLFASAGFTASVSIMFLVGGTLFSLLFLLPLYYQQVRVHNVFTAGLLVMPLGVGAMTGMPVAGRLADTLGAKLLVPIGGALIAAGAIVYRQADAGTP